METDDQELIIAANRYAEGGRKPEDLLEIAKKLANTRDPEEFQRKLRLLNGKQQKQKKKQSG